jgi:hypothetical protein
MALIWQAETLPDVDYTTTIQLLDDQNQVLAQRDATPLDGAAPTTSWAVGEVVVDPATLTLPDNLGSGSLRLLIALYRPDSGERLLLIDGADHLTIPVTTR